MQHVGVVNVVIRGFSFSQLAIAIDDSISKLVAILVSPKPVVGVRCALLDVLGTLLTVEIASELI